MALSVIVFLTGITISAVAAYYSIIGLTAIFAGAFWPIVIMGSALEVGKLASVSWLYNNWKLAPVFLKSYLSAAIIVLMLITSMGIFGFLSKAHIEQQVNINSGAKEQIEILDFQIKTKEDSIADIDREIEQINAALEKMTERGQAKSSLSAADGQKRNRDNLLKRKQAVIKELSEIKIQKIKLDSESRKVEAEVGPIKYVAEIIYGSSDNKVVDKAIRFVIILLIFVFDPLAVLLLIAFNISINAKDNYTNMEFIEIKNTKIKKPKRKERANTTPSLPLEGGTF